MPFDDDPMFTDPPATAPSPPVLHSVPLPRPARSDSLLRVRVAPLVVPGDGGADTEPEESEVTETVMDMQLIVDYTSALAKRTASRVKAGQVDTLEHSHRHPHRATCLRCAVLGTSRDLTMGTTLLEILARANADEDWNATADPPDPDDFEDGKDDPTYRRARRSWDPSKACTDTKIISRLRRLAVSSASMEDIYGPNWGQVMLMCLRAEAADFTLLHHLVQKYQASRILTVHTRHSLAAYHLAQVTCPWTTRDQGTVTPMLRGSVAVRLAVAAAAVAEGDTPEWVDHLPAPVL